MIKEQKIKELFRKLKRRLPGNRVEYEKRNARALRKLIQMVLKKNIIIAEIGCWKGLSTAVLAKAIANHNGKVFAIDHWMGNEGVSEHEVAKAKDIYSIFKDNLMKLGVWDTVYPLVMDSQTASEIFRDGILDLVFIDADHRYEGVKKDISFWLPKLKQGGILCGHDCEGYYKDFSEQLKKKIDKSLEQDYVKNIGHPGVIKGVYDFFGEEYSIVPNSIIWYYIKNN